MAYYLVSAQADQEKITQLKKKLVDNKIRDLNPFGEALSYSLRHMRRDKQGNIFWEEEDYCDPPLDEERKAVLDSYFDELKIEPVKKGSGWAKVVHLPFVYPDLAMKL